eukprot:6190889-Pleurochrysis_carterae.AAC.1
MLTSKKNPSHIARAWSCGLSETCSGRSKSPLARKRAGKKKSRYARRTGATGSFVRLADHKWATSGARASHSIHLTTRAAPENTAGMHKMWRRGPTHICRMCSRGCERKFIQSTQCERPKKAYHLESLGA